MSKDSENIEKFVNLLKEQGLKTPLALYKDKSLHNSELKQPISAQDVILNVSKQLKAIQNADCMKRSKKSINLNKYKKSTFLPVNMLRIDEEPPPQKPKFETQQFSDTQLITVVQDAEELYVRDGITQEFEESFCQNHGDEGDDGETAAQNTNNKQQFPIIDISLKDTDIKSKNDFNSSLTPLPINTETLQNKANENKDCLNIENIDYNRVIERDSQLYNGTQILNECIDTEDVNQINIESEETVDNMPSSPVFSIKCKKSKSNILSPLTFNLESFEKFEEIANPVLESVTDCEIAKQMINSQIIDKELFIEVDNEPYFNQISPIIEVNEDIRIDKEIICKKENKSTVIGETRSRESSGDKSVFKDEILFSSDEEGDDINRNFNDLPFTCALQTSFYDQSDVLDKTMYVGFQTASNKSIQISTDSFYKAKDILDGVEKDLTNETSLTSLVKVFDSTSENKDVKSLEKNEKVNVNLSLDEPVKEAVKTVKEETAGVTGTKLNQADEYMHLDFIQFEIKNKSIDLFKEFELQGDKIEDNDVINNKGENKFEGFKTASNKAIELSDKALARTKKVFQDIDSNDDELQRYIEVSKKEKDKDSNVNLGDLDEEVLQEFQYDIPHEDLKDNKEFNKEFVGFKTASNKDIQITDAALAKTKKIFQDIEFSAKLGSDIENEDLGKVDDIKTNNYKTTEVNEPSVGFKTASNKNITISKKAIEMTKTIFHEIDNDFENNNTNNESTSKNKHDDNYFNQPSTSKAPVTFKIGNEEIEISNDASKDIENLFRDDVFALNEESSKDIAFTGFKTASNKKIKISDEALLRTKKLFQDIDNNLFQSTEKSANKETGTVFETTSNKCIEISKEAIMKTNLFQNDDDIFVKPFEKTERKAAFTGFKTASKKNIDISEEALFKTKNLFQGIDNLFDKPHQETGRKEILFAGFKTASNKKVCISNKALAKSKKVFEGIERDFNFENENKYNEEIEPPFHGFEDTVKDIALFEETLAKSQKIFEKLGESITVTNSSNKNEPSNEVNKEQTPKSQGFQTVSCKPVTISEEALAETKRVFADIDKLSQKDDFTEKFSTENDNNFPKFKGFHSASNKKVKISTTALAKSRKIFEDIYKNEGSTINPETAFKGFQTATNKQVEISEQALAKSKKMFENIDNNNDGNRESFKIGFQTASNKDVNISEEALVKSRKMFADIDNENDNDINTDNTFKGFQTANNKEVKISKDALAKTKKIFEDINDTTKISPATFSGFQTANNKDVKISEAALAKSRKLFDDFDKEVANTKNMNAQGFSFQTANKKVIKISEKALIESKKLLTEIDGISVSEIDEGNTKNKQSDTTNMIEIDTQVLNNFEITLHSEDFAKTSPKTSKRSGSPILSCPKAKRRKIFQTPYSEKRIEHVKESTFVPPKIIEKTEQIVKFDSNYKKSKKYCLKDLQKIDGLSSNSNVQIDTYITKFNNENLLNFEFSGKRNDLTAQKLNITDLKTIFLNTINKKLIPENWLNNHIKLILWKLLSYEIKFPNAMSYICTAKAVIEQLKYRYDKELYNAQRPALRKIMEKDDTSMRMLVLCVVSIYTEDNSSTKELLLTDGWYCIRAIIDKMLSGLVRKGKITVGTKLVTVGAELVGSDQAVSPWEDTSSIRLKIHANSTRRARWDARLGYHGNGAILSQLSIVSPDGGKISKLRVFVTRVYPMLYVEKFEDGSTVTRSERLESIHQMRYETERQGLLEKLYEEVEREVYDQDSQDSETVETGGKRRCLDSGTQIFKMMKHSRDPGEFKSTLTSSQTELLDGHTIRQREKLLRDIQDRVQNKMAKFGLSTGRNVVPLLKMRVAGIEERNCEILVTKAMLSIWKPNDAITEIIKEGVWIEMLNVAPTALRYSEIQISAGRQSVFSQSKYKENEKIKPYTQSLKRICYPIKDLVKNPCMTTDYNEIDTAGIVFQIDPSIKEFDCTKHQFQNVYLTDADKNIICVNFWGGLKKFGFENVLDTGQIVVGTNLQKRAGNTRKNVPQYRVTEFSHFTKTPKNENARKLIEELSKKMYGIDRRKFNDYCISLKNNYTSKQSENVTPYRATNIDINLSKNKVFLDSPLAGKNEKIEDNLNLTGLDFESTFKQTDTEELSPKTLLRKKQINEKIAKLRMYGEPPPLSPIQIINKSKNAGNAFKSPLMSKSDVSIQSVASEKKNLPEKENFKILNDDTHCSPVICLNRTYVKKTGVKPVKLNFSNVAINDSSLSEVADDFAEEFDGSPPLSLD